MFERPTHAVSSHADSCYIYKLTFFFLFTLLLIYWIFPAAKYVSVVITFISGIIALWCGERRKRISNELHKHYRCTILSVAFH